MININKNVICIIQARLDSTRLPGKVLKKINNKTILELLIHRLKKSKKINKIVIATTKKNIDNKILSIAKKISIDCFRGSENDVLARYFHCASKFKSNVIVRITADCPLVDYNLVDRIINFYFKKKLDYASNTLKRSFPDGLDIEVFSFNALKDAFKKCKEKNLREHVTPYIINNKNLKKKNFSNTKDLSNKRWTVDENIDYIFVKKIFEYFKKNLYFNYHDILKLEKKKPEIFKLNSHLAPVKKPSINKGQEFWNRALDIIPDGNMLLSKRPNIFLPNYWPTYFKKASGYKITDLENITYDDFSFMGVGTNILGYANKFVDKEVRRAVKQGNISTLNSVEELYLAEKLIDLHPWAHMVKFARTGGEASTIAIRIARATTNKDCIAVCGYHGWHDWYLAANLNDKKNLDNHLFPNLSIAGVSQKLKNTTFKFDYNDINGLKKLLNNQNNIGTIIMEVRRNKKPKNNFLKKVRDLANQKNIILIFDECTSGFRENFGGLHKKYKVSPDICIFGKALGNGYPINAVIGKREVMENATKSFISSTFWTERIGPAAAIKTMEIMEKEKSWKYLSKYGNEIKKTWKEIAHLHKIKLIIEGLDAIPIFSFDHADHLKFKTFLTQEMLDNKIMATNTVYVCTKHNRDLLKKYSLILSNIFQKIRLCMDEKLKIEHLIRGPIALGGLRQKKY